MKLREITWFLPLILLMLAGCLGGDDGDAEGGVQAHRRLHAGDDGEGDGFGDQGERHHGQYGPDAERVLSEMFGWLYSE